MNRRVELTYLTLWEALQDAFIEQRTGCLVCSLANGPQKLVLLSGQLYLSGSNPCRDRLERLLMSPSRAEENPHFSPQRYLATVFADVVEQLSSTMAGWRVNGLRFREGLDEIPDDLVGPVPTAELVMELSTLGCSLEEILDRIGGLDVAVRSVADYRARRRVPYLSPDDTALLERLAKREAVRVVLAESPAPEQVAWRLARLLAVGLLEKVSEPGRVAPATSREVLQRLEERVGHDLDMNPIDLEPEKHRAQLVELLADYGRLGYYDLLGVSGDATPDQVHAAYMRRARLAHPRHADLLGAGKGSRKLAWLMARLTEAYLVLSDPERAGAYKRGGGMVPEPQPHGAGRPDRGAERADLARDCYRTALDHVEAEDYFYAIELLKQAVRTHPRPEYYTLLGHCQMENPKWMHMAIDSFRRAVALSPDDDELRRQLAAAMEEYRRHGASLEPSGQDGESRDARRARRAVARLRANRR